MEDQAGHSKVARDGEVEAPLWPMGAVTRHTGIGEHTLRAWERRFGFPSPVRLPSGHRRYPTGQVQQLVLISAALEQGYRAGDVVTASHEQLLELLRERDEVAASPVTQTGAGWLRRMLTSARQFDRAAIVDGLHRDATVLGLPRLLSERIVPLLQAVGDEWSRGNLEIRHEHFLSEILEDTLRGLRVSLDAAAHGPPVLLASLPSEVHGLGLHLAALTIASEGREVRILGIRTPVDEIVAASTAVSAAAVGLSVSVNSTGPETEAALAELRRNLPKETRLWVGGGGASALENLADDVLRLSSLEDLRMAVRLLAALPEAASTLTTGAPILAPEP